MTGDDDQEPPAEPERGEVTGFHVVDPELYVRHRDAVLALGNSHQRNINEFLPADRRGRAWSDAEIAAAEAMEEAEEELLAQEEAAIAAAEEAARAEDEEYDEDEDDLDEEDEEDEEDDNDEEEA